MNEHELRGLIAQVKHRELSRRSFLQKMSAVGISAPMAGVILSQAGVAFAQAVSKYKPERAGGGGPLKLLSWQAPTLLNPHFAAGFKDQEACRIFYEPLAGWDSDANLQPILAQEIPSIENGGLDRDGRFVIWRLKPGVKWHDGKPFTADDCVFTWQYASDLATAAVNLITYKSIRVEKIDDITIKISFEKPTPFWPDAFVGARGMVIPKHIFEAYKGSNAREAPANLAPVGTGPYKFVNFRPGDVVLGEINRDYHVKARPFFDSIELKGGGDAVSAARTVLQTGEYDFAFNLQVEDEILKKLSEGGKGTVAVIESGNIEFIALQQADPWNEVDGERASLKTTHPLLGDKAVRSALSYLLDRKSIEKFIYGRTGVATGNFVNNPERFRSRNTNWEYNVEKANQVLEEAGWKRGTDGIRTKDGKRLQFVLQTSINAPRQKSQAVFKQACQKAGIGMELKSIAASVFFSSDAGNPDTYQHFYCDLEMIQSTVNGPDPVLLMSQFCSWQAATKANNWQGRNITRWKNAEFDQAFQEAENEIDPIKRALLFVKMNDLVVSDVAVIPLVYRPITSGIAQRLVAPLSGWDNNLWLISDWYREA